MTTGSLLNRLPGLQFSVLEPGVRWGDAPAIAACGDQVHLWRISMDEVAKDRAGALRALLSEDEKRRAARFGAARDRERYIVRRGVLRCLLGDYLAIEAAAVAFQYGRFGKPALAGPPRRAGIEFSVSHREQWALIALAQGRAVGIDIEFLHRPLDLDAIAGQFFSADEAAAWRGSPRDSRAEAFFRIWTRREAILKAHGTGLAGLDSFTALARACDVRDFIPAESFVASVAISIDALP